MDSGITVRIQELDTNVITIDSFIDYVFTTYGVETEEDFVTLLAELNNVQDKNKTRLVVEALIERVPQCHQRIFGYYTNILVELDRTDLLAKELISYKSQFNEDKQSTLLELYLLLKDGFEENADKIIALTESIK